jgi:AraC-like DNA-binding protein
MVSIQTFTPTVLSSFIKSFWYLKIPENLNQPYVENILPDGHPEIIIHVNAPPKRKKTGCEIWQHDPQVFFTGQNRKSYKQRLWPGSVIFAIRFYPHTQAILYNFPASFATDNQIPLSDLSIKDIFSGCISEVPEQTFKNFEKVLVKAASELNNYGAPFQYVDAAIRKIMQQKGDVKIEFLEKITGISVRHLELSFKKFVGVSPKQFCNIIRFSHFVNYRKNHPNKTLTECACETDFYDQSHLIYLSNLITGESPKSYFTRETYINDFFL